MIRAAPGVRKRPRIVAMAASPPPDLDNCFHCPQGDKPCPVTYQPPGHGWPSNLPNQHLQARTAPGVLTTSTPASSRPSANCTRPWPATPDDLAALPADMESAQVTVGVTSPRSSRDPARPLDPLCCITAPQRLPRRR